MRRWHRRNIGAAVSRTPITEQPQTQVKGLAQTFVKPSYVRLLSAEPTLRRGVPILVVAFMLTIIIGGAVQVLDSRRQTIETANEIVFNASEILRTRLQSTTFSESDAATKLNEAIKTKPEILSRVSLVNVYLANQHGTIVATSPPNSGLIGHLLSEAVTQKKVETVGTQSWLEKLISNEHEVIGASQRISNGQFFLYQNRRDALRDWRHLAILTSTLTLTTSFVVLILGFAFSWQATRAREADQIYDVVRSRIDSALMIGRCGLWHLNLDTREMYWSSSMFESLGLKPDDTLQQVDDVSRLIHPADIEISELFTNQSVERVFRMLHARRGWIWIRLRCEIGIQEDKARYLIGTATELSKDQIRTEINDTQVVKVDALERDSGETPGSQDVSSKIDGLVRKHVDGDGAVELAVRVPDERALLRERRSGTQETWREAPTDLAWSPWVPVLRRITFVLHRARDTRPPPKNPPLPKNAP